jgi:hypothetical protein
MQAARSSRCAFLDREARHGTLAHAHLKVSPVSLLSLLSFPISLDVLLGLDIESLSVLLHVFSVEQCIVGKLPEARNASDPPAGLETLCREQERRKRVLGWRRTHKDPFEGEWEQIFCWLQANPER